MDVPYKNWPPNVWMRKKQRVSQRLIRKIAQQAKKHAQFTLH